MAGAQNAGATAAAVGGTAVAGGATAVAGGPAPVPASGEPIKVGAIFDLTGPTADVSKPYSQGVIAFVDWKNANGGVAGRPIELISQDYAYDTAKAEELYTQFVGENVVAFSGWGTGDTEALKNKITQDKIPFISGSYSAALANPAETPYNFLTAPTYSDQLVVAMKWALEDWKAKGNSDAPKFAYLINDSPFGRSPLADGTAFATANGVAEPIEVPSPKGATDLTPQLTQIKDSGANYVFIQNTAAPASLALKNAKSLGLETQFVCLNWCANELLVKLAGPDAEGVAGTIPFSPTGPGAEVAIAYAKEKGIDFGGADSSFVQGWTAMSILVAGIE
ncbi:MAG: ABC transporter substrate-binding protein, partial [Chloroflexales bacterium]|nr:ABC transporter substrate-binding protein [Chloroflexales bacterium]